MRYFRHEDSVASSRMPWSGTALMCGVLLGTALQLQQVELWAWIHYMLCAAAASALLMLLLRLGSAIGVRRRRLRRLRCLRTAHFAALVLMAALLVFGVCGLRSGAFLAGALSPALEGRDVEVQGIITDMPQVKSTGLRFRFRVESASLDGRSVPLPELIDLAWYGHGLFDLSPAVGNGEPLPRLSAGERWRLKVRLKAPHGARNPHGFDYELWLWEQGVQAAGYVRVGGAASAQPPALIERTSAFPVERWRQHVRDGILARLSPVDATAAQRRAAGVVAALVVGDQRVIDQGDWDVFRITGVAHLVSISGLHITLFAWLAAAVIGAGWRRSAWLCTRVSAPAASMLGGLLLASAYAIFSGWGVPAQRTIFMLATVTLLRLAGRRWPWPLVWLLACTLVLLADPWAMLQAGFWLSFVAVGILFATDARAQQQDAQAERGLAALLHKTKTMMREQWVVMTALTPLTLLLFGQMSIVGFIANLLAIPWVTLVVTPIAFAGVLIAPLWHVAAWTVRVMN